MQPLPSSEIRKLKAAAQRLKPILKLGKTGVTPDFLNSVQAALNSHELIKIKLEYFKDERKTLAPELAEKTDSHLVTLLGNVVVLYRKRTHEQSPTGQ
jgi:RNA-binding protein